MLLVIHVVSALASISVTSLSIFKPTKNTSLIGYLFVATTLISGTGLILGQPVFLKKTCLSGVVYIAIILIFRFVMVRKQHNLPQTI